MKPLLTLAFLVLAQTSVQSIPCNRPVQKTLVFPISGADGGAQPCPAVALTGRKSITLCSSRKNGGNPVWTLNWDADGGWPTTALGPTLGNGLGLSVGDCVTLALPSGTPVRCIADTVDAGIEITECR